MHKHTPLLSFLAILCATCATRPDPAATADPSPETKPVAAQPTPVAPRPRLPAQPVQWIWASPNASATEVVALQRTFDVPRPIARATLRGSADNRVRLFLNGELVAEHDEWRTGIEAEVGPYLRLGSNSLVLCAKNEGGPAAAWAELEVEDPSGRRVRVVSDGSWSAVRVDADVGFTAWEPHDFDEARSGPAHSFGPLGIAPWLDVQGFPPIASAAEAEKPDEPPLAASALELLPGFAAELVYAVPKRAQGSWVTLCEDPQGRLYTSDQHGRLYRIVIPRGDSRAEPQVELVDIEIGSAHGLCWAFGSLYVVVSERDPGRVCGLYRVRDTDGDDKLDQTELVREFDGNGEHGPHAVVLGPDNSLWIMGGNHTALPEPIDSYRRPKTWGEDELLPTIPDPNGHAVGITAPGGWVVRTDERGEKWELWTAGFRNAYDMAFDSRGELFTFDSDMEWDVGAPWYRPTRILHCVSGAEFGWRTGSGNWPTDWPDTWPATCDVGRGSPTGTIFGTGAVAFHEKYQRALYACDWALGRIYAVHMTRRGASWSGEAEVFARGEPFPVTDVIIAKDAAMYVVTGGRGTQSGLYRITSKGVWDGLSDPPPGLSPEQEERRRLEALHVPGSRSDAELERIARGLASPDAFLAGAARVALEHTPTSQWPTVWEQCNTPLAASRFALAQILAGEHVSADALITVEQILADAPPEIPRLHLLRLVQLALLRFPVHPDAQERIRAMLLQGFPSGDPRLDRELARMLAYFEVPGIIDALLEHIDASTTQEDAIHYAYCLRTVDSGWTLESRQRFLDFLDGRARTFRGGESLEKFVGVIRREFVEAIPAEGRAALGIRLDPAPVATTSSAIPAAAPAFVHRWTRAELDALLHEWPVDRQHAAGRAAFDKATCATCHRTGDGGGATGPDLTGVSSRFSRADLLDAMLEPSRTISDQYRDTELRTTEGDLHVGRIEAERDGTIVLRKSPSDERVEIDAATVEMRRPYPLSRMPSGLLDVLSEDEVLDLFAYLRSTR